MTSNRLTLLLIICAVLVTTSYSKPAKVMTYDEIIQKNAVTLQENMEKLLKDDVININWIEAGDNLEKTITSALDAQNQLTDCCINI